MLGIMVFDWRLAMAPVKQRRRRRFPVSALTPPHRNRHHRRKPE
jgi:hypothetical protein